MPTIVVIDDDKANNTLIQTMLRDYTVYTTGSAEEGIQLIRKVQPDLVLLDLRMPGMDGITATQIIKADPATIHIPIIAVTASMVGTDLKNAVDAGCDGYLSKPFKPSELKALIRRYLE